MDKKKTVNFSGFRGPKTPLFEVKNEGVKTALFGKKAYLIVISFCQIAVFAVFDEKHRFLTPL